jgi:hypothetical protein
MRLHISEFLKSRSSLGELLDCLTASRATGVGSHGELYERRQKNQHLMTVVSLSLTDCEH